jgi:hypothetical protein
VYTPDVQRFQWSKGTDTQAHFHWHIKRMGCGWSAVEAVKFNRAAETISTVRLKNFQQTRSTEAWNVWRASVLTTLYPDQTNGRHGLPAFELLPTSFSHPPQLIPTAPLLKFILSRLIGGSDYPYDLVSSKRQVSCQVSFNKLGTLLLDILSLVFCCDSDLLQYFWAICYIDKSNQVFKSTLNPAEPHGVKGYV